MNQEIWRKVEDLFHAALERPPEARKAFLAGSCPEDSDLRRQVELLLSKEEQAGSFLERPALASATVTLLGRQVGPYGIVSPLGAGGMGEVYRAHDNKLGRDVAIKTLPVEFARDPQRLARLRREARTLASLNHPNIAAIYGIEESGEVDCLVLELVEGETPRGPLSVEKALDYARQIADALEAAHNKGVVHRDLKPANVKVTPQGKVKVLDFGLAKAIWGAEGDQDLSQRPAATGVETLTGHIVGTPGYMSPEQARGLDVDKRTDIWAFGCLLYELLTGKRAFPGETLPDTIAVVLEREPDWQALPAKMPAKVRDLLRQCLQKDADRRLPSIADARKIIDVAQRGRNHWWAAVIGAALAAVGVAAALWLRSPSQPLDRSAWVQLTNLTDSAAQPALSPDGRMLAFIRGPGTFVSPGQVYVKMLPDGEPVSLTRDQLPKMSPVFSADGTHIAYTARTPSFSWDTWLVPVAGGDPRLWLRNASGLTWSGPHRVLFSEIKKGLHMGLVAAEESLLGARDVYLPDNERGMAHRSYVSPDGKSVLLVEMDKDGLWGPCRVVPFDGGAPGRQVGPPAADCTFGAWSPDGKWIYITSKAGGSHHIWRQRFPDGVPEQVTAGPTEEEGVAMAPDGRSFVTAVALQTGAIWIDEAGGKRQISLEGNAFYAKFTPDGKKLCYLVLKSVVQPGTNRDPGEVWVVDLTSGRSEPVAPGFRAFSYDISPDGRQIVMEVVDKEGKPRLWLSPLNRSAAPRQIPNIEGRECLFGSSGDIFFRRTEGASGFVYRVHTDGTGLRKALERPVLILFGVAPDERWILGWAALEHDNGSNNQAIPVDGGPPVRLGAIGWMWAPGGRSMAIKAGPRCYLVPLAPGQALPKMPAAGLLTEHDVATLPGARRIDESWVSASPSPDVYAFYRSAVHRNLYRIPIP
jgi:serine/threonine protein kinase/Tol biopolymer transport system component